MITSIFFAFIYLGGIPETYRFFRQLEANKVTAALQALSWPWFVTEVLLAVLYQGKISK